MSDNDSYLSEGFDANLMRPLNTLNQQGNLLSRTYAEELNFDPQSGDVPLIARPVSSDSPNVFSLSSQTPNDIKNGIPPKSITLDQLVIDQLGITDYISSIGFETGVQGWIINGNGDAEFNNGVFRGALSASTIDIGGADATSFHVDLNGNMWAGASSLALAPFSVTSAGAIAATSGTIGGWSITATSINSGASTQTVGFDSTITGADDVRLYAGSATPASAPFRVTENGVLTATNATITGTITATAGTIGGFTIGADYVRDAANSFGLSATVTGGDDVRFWAGDTFANRATAPFRITEAGAITAGTGSTITTNTGFKANLYYDGSNTFTNSNNVKTSDDTYATTTAANSQQYGGYDFNIPNNASIIGIEITLEGHDNHGAGTAATARVQVSWDGGTTFSTQTAYTMTLQDTTDASATTGSNAYLFGRIWSVNEFLEHNFKTKIEVVALNGATTVSFDCLLVKVHYTYTSQLTYNGTDISMAGGTITGGRIASAISGARIELSTLGLKSYDSNGDKRIEISDDQITFLLGTVAGYGFAGKIYTVGSTNNASLVMQPSATGVSVILNPELYQRFTGWVNFNQTATYVSATTFTMVGNLTDRLDVGTKLRLVQTTTKWFYVSTTPTYDGGTGLTTVTVTGGSDYTLANAAITSPYYSNSSNPVGFHHWFAYTPTGVSATNVTLTGRYKISDGTSTVDMSMSLTGDITFTTMQKLPITASANILTPTGGAIKGLGAYLSFGVDYSSTGLSPIVVASATTVNIVRSNGASMSATIPVTWKNQDWGKVYFTYEI